MKPICLPYHDDVYDNYRRDKNGVDLEAVIAGWGATVNKGKSFSMEYFCEYLINIFQNISTFIVLPCIRYKYGGYITALKCNRNRHRKMH